MAAASLILVVLIVALSIAVLLFVRAWGTEQSRREARILDPRTPTLAFAIPNGVDPVVFELALNQAGFDCLVDRVGDAECLRVECAESDRTRLRRVIESVHLRDYDGSELNLEHVVFEDER